MNPEANAARRARLVFIGPPASGKGTQGRRIASALGLTYLSTGALLRDHMERDTELGQVARPILDRGGYLSDEWMCQLIGDWLETAADGWVLDGFPRSVPQAKFLDERLMRQGKALDLVVSLEAPLEVLRERIVARVECPQCRWSGHVSESGDSMICPDCGAGVRHRADDHLENFLSRHREYETFTAPLIRHYSAEGILCSCDAAASRDEVTRQLLDRLSYGGRLVASSATTLEAHQ